jgi:hypothetical protein
MDTCIATTQKTYYVKMQIAVAPISKFAVPLMADVIVSNALRIGYTRTIQPGMIAIRGHVRKLTVTIAVNRQQHVMIMNVQQCIP